MTEPLVSVIITTKNEADHLAVCLRSVKSQTYRDIEIIVVDNRSSDDTKRIAEKFTRRVYDKGPERSAQRNFGAEKAAGGYVLFLDADMTVSPSVVGACVESVDSHKALIIPEKSFGTGFWAKCKVLERESYEGVDWMEAPRFYKKTAFRSIGGFDESLTGPEDYELSHRLMAKFGTDAIGRVTQYILHDEGHLSLAKLLVKKYYYGRQMRRYGVLPESRGYFVKQSNILSRYGLFFRKPKRFFRDPVHALGMLLMKTLEMGVLALGGL